MKRLVFQLPVFVLTCAGFSRLACAQLNYQTITDPAGVATYCEGISGSTVVGYFQDSGGADHGFTYNGTAFTTLDVPGALASFGTQVLAVSGSTVVGTYKNASGIPQGFSYQNGAYTTIDDPLGTAGSTVNGIDGTTLVGTYSTGGGTSQGFIDSSGVFTTLDDPHAASASSNGTFPEGVSGSVIVGGVTINELFEAFVYNGSTFSEFTAPSQTTPVVVSPEETVARGVSGSSIVGSYLADVYTNGITQPATGEDFGFVSNGSTFTTLTDPNALEGFGFGTQAQGIDGNTVVGYYTSNNRTQGFEVVVPEPSAGFFVLTSVTCFLQSRRHGTRKTA